MRCIIPLLAGISCELIHSLRGHPHARMLITGKIRRKPYAYYLAQTHHYVSWARYFLETAGWRMQEAGRHEELARLLLVKSTEESNHEAWALGDLEALGYTASILRRIGPNASVRGYLAFNRCEVEEGEPAAFLATAYVLERVSQELAPVAVENLSAHSTIEGIGGALSFLRGHAEEDEGHVARLAETLSVLRSSRELMAMERAARMTAAMLPGLFEVS